MGKIVLDAATSTALRRTTVHSQFNGRALGFYLLNNVVPIVLTIRKPGPSYKRAILVFGRKAHKRSPYQDFGIVETCCRTVYTFNIRHYVKCYLSSDQTGPYTYNNCTVCGASIVDGAGHTIQSIVKRSFRPDKYVWKAPEVLQESDGAAPVFNYHKGII